MMGVVKGREVAGLDSGGLVGWYTQWARSEFAGVVRMPNGHLLCVPAWGVLGCRG